MHVFFYLNSSWSKFVYRHHIKKRPSEIISHGTSIFLCRILKTKDKATKTGHDKAKRAESIVKHQKVINQP